MPFHLAKHLRSSAILVLWSALVGPGRPWSAAGGGFPGTGKQQKNYVGKKSQFENFCKGSPGKMGLLEFFELVNFAEFLLLSYSS
jgi:hypothetical protein